MSDSTIAQEIFIALLEALKRDGREIALKAILEVLKGNYLSRNA
jgi:hypothetical protein